MRTDPRAEDVREIVERVFADYLHRSRRAKAVKARRAKAAAFPRLFEPVAAAYSAFGAFGEADYDRDESFEDDDAAGSTLRFPHHSPEPEPRTRHLEIDETILIDGGRYVARSYRAEGYLAMWLVAVGIVQFYDDCGNMLATINLFQTLRPKRMAA